LTLIDDMQLLYLAFDELHLVFILIFEGYFKKEPFWNFTLDEGNL